MKKLLAKLKSHKAEFRVIFDQDNMPEASFLPKPEVAQAVEYAPFYESEVKDMWFYVDLDREQLEYMVEPYTDIHTFGVPGIEQPEYAAIDTLFLIDGTSITFAKVTNSMRIGEHGKQLIRFGEDKTELDRPSFAIDFTGEADAFFNGQNRLYFQNLAKVRGMFKGIDIFQQEATREEKEAFLSNDFFAVGEINPDFISLGDAQRIADIRENHRLDLEDPETQQKIRKYANEYPSSGAGINDEGQLIINNKNDLSAALKLLDQRFYTSELTGEKFEAKGVKPMKR